MLYKSFSVEPIQRKQIHKEMSTNKSTEEQLGLVPAYMVWYNNQTDEYKNAVDWQNVMRLDYGHCIEVLYLKEHSVKLDEITKMAQDSKDINDSLRKEASEEINKIINDHAKKESSIIPEEKDTPVEGSLKKLCTRMVNDRYFVDGNPEKDFKRSSVGADDYRSTLLLGMEYGSSWQKDQDRTLIQELLYVLKLRDNGLVKMVSEVITKAENSLGTK